MADQFKTLWECTECFGQFYFKSEAQKCCGKPVLFAFVCEVCTCDYETEDAARQCCFQIANPIPAARREIETRPLPRHLMEPDLGL